MNTPQLLKINADSDTNFIHKFYAVQIAVLVALILLSNLEVIPKKNDILQLKCSDLSSFSAKFDNKIVCPLADGKNKIETHKKFEKARKYVQIYLYLKETEDYTHTRIVHKFKSSVTISSKKNNGELPKVQHIGGNKGFDLEIECIENPNILLKYFKPNKPFCKPVILAEINEEVLHELQEYQNEIFINIETENKVNENFMQFTSFQSYHQYSNSFNKFTKVGTFQIVFALLIQHRSKLANIPKEFVTTEQIFLVQLMYISMAFYQPIYFENNFLKKCSEIQNCFFYANLYRIWLCILKKILYESDSVKSTSKFYPEKIQTAYYFVNHAQFLLSKKESQTGIISNIREENHNKFSVRVVSNYLNIILMAIIHITQLIRIASTLVKWRTLLKRHRNFIQISQYFIAYFVALSFQNIESQSSDDPALFLTKYMIPIWYFANLYYMNTLNKEGDSELFFRVNEMTQQRKVQTSIEMKKDTYSSLNAKEDIKCYE